MAIFHSYVKLPEGILWYIGILWEKLWARNAWGGFHFIHFIIQHLHLENSWKSSIPHGISKLNQDPTEYVGGCQRNTRKFRRFTWFTWFICKMGPPLPGLSTAPRGLALCGDEIVGSVGAQAKGWQWVICEAFLEKIGEPHSFTRGFTIFQTYVSWWWWLLLFTIFQWISCWNGVQPSIGVWILRGFPPSDLMIKASPFSRSKWPFFCGIHTSLPSGNLT